MALLLAACEASYPTTPTAPVPLALQLHFAQPLGDASIRGGYSFKAYVIRSDGAWEEVTNQVAWSSPNPAVFRSAGSGQFIADNLGASGVIAQYQGLFASVAIVVVDPARLPTPRLSVTAVAPQTGATLQSVSALVPITGSSRDVTGEATWTSSDPLVATVATGRVTARGPGTTRITVTHQGMTASYVFSVRPPAR
jgi:hypothetical protein